MAAESHNVTFRFGVLPKPNYPVAQKPLTTLDYAEVCRLEREARLRRDTLGAGKPLQAPQSRQRAFLRALVANGPMSTSEIADALGCTEASVGNCRRPLSAAGLIVVNKPSPTAQYVSSITDAGRAFLEAAQ